jgi:hypothetical protein
LGSPLGALVKADAEKWWPIIKTPGLRQSDAATVTPRVVPLMLVIRQTANVGSGSSFAVMPYRS